MSVVRYVVVPYSDQVPGATFEVKVEDIGQAYIYSMWVGKVGRSDIEALRESCEQILKELEKRYA